MQKVAGKFNSHTPDRIIDDGMKFYLKISWGGRFG